MGAFIRKEACPSCIAAGGDTRKDNLSVFDDGVFCFACGFVERRFVGDRAIQPATVRTREVLELPNAIAKVSKETYDYYGVTLEVRNDLLVLAYPYYDANGKLAKHKVRSVSNEGKLERDFKFHKVTDANIAPLFGYKQLLEQKYPVDVLLFEGERDLLTFHERFGKKPGWVYLGLPGTQNVNAAAIVLNDCALVKSLHVVFDEDLAGQEATFAMQEFSTKPTKCNTLTLDKDVSDSIESIPEFETFVSDYFVERLIPHINKSAFAAFQEFREASHNPLFTFEDELPGLAPLFIPRRGMFCIIAGDTGSGKSFFVDWTMLKAIANKQHVLLVSLEMTPGEVYTRLIYQLTGVYATRGDISADSLKLIKQWCVAFDEYLHVSTHPEPSVTTIEAQLKAYGGDISFIVVDTISLFCKNLEWQELNALSYELKRKFAMAKIYNNPFVVAVSQMSLKGVSKNKVSTSNMFGASNIAQAPDLVLFIDTDVNAVEQTTLIKVIKRDRSAGQFGSVNVRFDFEAGNFYEVSAVGSSSDEVDF